MAKSEDGLNYKTLNDVIEAKILDKRRVFICDAVTQESAAQVIKKLWYLDILSPKTPITLVINSPGGAVDAGFAIWDQVKLLTSPVTTIVTGLAASMGSILSLCAEKGRCFATPNTRVMIHQPLLSGVIQGQATDLDIQAREMIKTRTRLVNIYVEKTGKSFDEIEKAIDRDTWMTAEEAKDYGLVDQIVNSFEEL
jgi:ATP-dependent Clp protease protease subunit